MRWRHPLALLVLGWAAIARPTLGACVLDTPDCCTSPADCDDGTACNGEELCQLDTGTCVAGTPKDCDDHDVCTTDSCIDTAGCTHVPNTAACDDGNACTEGDQCAAGACVPGTPRACPGDACHDTGTCNPATGACLNPNRPDGTPCPDDSFCNGADTCKQGVCTHAGDPCTRGGECRNHCNDVEGTCASPAGEPCADDGDACTIDACNGDGTCMHTLDAAGHCDDGDACTHDDRCTATGCAGIPTVCAAPDACHLAGTCDAATGQCQNPIAPNGTACASDGTLCTTDACRDGACLHTPDDTRCDHGACTVATCQPGASGANAAGCVSTPVNENATCTDDGFACTNDVCRSGTCAHLPVDARCGPATECNSPVCAPERGDATSGCAPSASMEDGAYCAEDADPCSDDRCTGAACTHQRVAPYETCQPIDAAWDQARGLTRGSRALREGVSTPAQVNEPSITNILARLQKVADALQAATDTLGGRAALEPPASPIETNGQRRARSALARLATVTDDLGQVLRLVNSPRVRATLTTERATLLRQDGKVLLRGVRQLKIELRKLKKISKSLAH